MLLNEKDILHIINGAALLASGGGGSVADGLDLLANYKKRHPGEAVQVELIDAAEMAEGVRAVMIAGMGAPTKGAHKDFIPCAEGAYDGISGIAAREGKRIGYTLPIEMGGFNTLAPMLVSLARKHPIIDADGAGRAVPGLDTVLVHVNGYDTSPLAMADERNNRVEITMADPRDAAGAQKIAAPIANGYFDGNAGIAGWMLDRSQIEDALPRGTITLARKIGLIIEKAGAAGTGGYVGEIFGMINELDGIKARALTTAARISGYTPNVNPNFDNGYYYISGGHIVPQFKIAYENENLVLYAVKDGAELPVMTAPDIITLYNAKTGEPVTNEDIDQRYQAGTLDDLEAVLGIIRVSDTWWKNPELSAHAWKGYFAEAGYTGNILRYPETEGKSAV